MKCTKNILGYLDVVLLLVRLFCSIQIKPDGDSFFYSISNVCKIQYVIGIDCFPGLISVVRL
jgi:hypothetical protein